MRIGITYDLKEENGLADLPDDADEEFDSPATIEAIAEVIRGVGHEVEKLGDGRELLERLLARPPDFVFNFAEGRGVGRSREARVPAVLEMLGIPYTGSDPLTLAVTLDKDCAKRLVASAGLVCPRGELITADGTSAPRLDSNWRFPLILKPAWEGSSKGIRRQCIVDRCEDLQGALESLSLYEQPVLMEEYVEGDEITVGILGNDPPTTLGIMRVLPRQPVARFIYSLEVKREFRRMVRYECPPRLPEDTVEAISRAALTAYRVLGCRDVARIDFRVREGVPYFLEVNPLPGLNPETSDLVIMADLVGWSYSKLIEAIVEAAFQRHFTSAPTSSDVPIHASHNARKEHALHQGSRPL